MKQTFTRNKKAKSKIFAFRSVSEAIGRLKHNCEIFGFNKGQFYLIDIMSYILKQVGKSDLDIITWAIGNETIDKLVHLQALGLIGDLRLILDYSYRTMHPEYCQKLRDIFGDDSIRVTKNHSKITLIRNKDWNLSIRSSMNLNINRRLEYFEISDDAELMGFLQGFFEDWFKTKSTGESFDYPTKFHTDELNKFGDDGNNRQEIDMDLDLNIFNGDLPFS